MTARASSTNPTGLAPVARGLLHYSSRDLLKKEIKDRSHLGVDRVLRGWGGTLDHQEV
jgi:hypothetical protein